jgi:hypothetical protein
MYLKNGNDFLKIKQLRIKVNIRFEFNFTAYFYKQIKKHIL